MTRDLTRKQFVAALKRRGFKYAGFMGYWQHESGISINEANGATLGPRGGVTLPKRRERLARMVQTLDRMLKQREATS